MRNFSSSLGWILNHPNNRGKFFSTIFKLTLWKLNQLSFKIPYVIEMAWGIKLKCYPDSSWGGLVIYTRLPEYYEMNFVKKIIRNDDIFFDVGSNLGSYSLIAASTSHNSKVYAFEPSKKAYNRLLENLKLNGYGDRIKTFNYAVSDKSSQLGFTDDPRPEISHISYFQKMVSRKVKAVSLDDFISNLSIKKIKLIKIDVEGYEYMVLKGASKILRKSIVDYFLIEINKDSFKYKIDPDKIFSFLKSYGYNTYYFRNSSRLTPVSELGEEKKTINIIAIKENIHKR